MQSAVFYGSIGYERKEGCSIFLSRNVLEAKGGFLWFKCARERLIRSLKKERATLLLVCNVVMGEKGGCSVFVWIGKERCDMFILEKKCRPCNGFTIHGEDKEFNSVYSLIIKP